MMKGKRAQAALEFLTTYGWAVIMVIVTASAVIYFNIIPSSTTVAKCSFQDGVVCDDFDLIRVSATEYYFDALLKNPSSDTYYVDALSIKTDDSETYCTSSVLSDRYGGAIDNAVLSFGGQKTVRFTFEDGVGCSVGAAGLTTALDKTVFNLELTYRDNPTALPLATLGKAEIVIAGSSALPAQGCSGAQVACAADCAYGGYSTDAGISGCFFDDACAVPCFPLNPGDEVQTIPLQTGTNFVSTYIIPADAKMNSIFASLIAAGTLKAVSSQDGTLYDAGLGINFAPTDKWDVEQAYMVDVYLTTNLLLIGQPQSGPYTLTLQAGTNYVGVPKGATESVFESVLSLIAENNLIDVRDAMGNTISKTTEWTDTGIGNLVEGEGYIIELSSAPLLPVTWPLAVDEYEIFNLTSGTNYIVSSIDTLTSAKKVFDPLVQNGYLSYIEYKDSSTTNILYSSGSWNPTTPIAIQDTFELTTSQAADMVITGNLKSSTFNYVFLGTETFVYMGIPEGPALDPYDLLGNLLLGRQVQEVTDDQGNKIYFNGSSWVNNIGLLNPHKHYMIELQPNYGWSGSIGVFPTLADCQFSSICQTDCGVAVAFSQFGNCFTDSACTAASACYACAPSSDPTCDSQCGVGLGFQQGASSCYDSSSCNVLCNTCNPDATCCGGNGYRDAVSSVCFQDSSCSNPICSYTQNILTSDPTGLGKQLVSVYVQPSGSLLTYDFFQNFFVSGAVDFITDRYGNIMYSDGTIVPSGLDPLNGLSLKEIHAYEGYELTIQSIGFADTESGPAIDPTTNLNTVQTGDPNIYYEFSPLVNENLFGVPIDLPDYSVTAIFGSMASVIDYVKNDEEKWYVPGVTQEFTTLVPGEAYRVKVNAPYSLDINSLY